MLRTRFVSAIASLLASGSLLAQTGVITGSVTSAEGVRPIGGAQIRIVGTTTGGLSRDDGRFSIAVAPGTYTVRVSRIGFAPDSQAGIVVASGATVTADFRLRESARVLEGMVVTGYGEVEARDRTRAQALLYVNALRQRAYGDASGNITDAQLTLDFIRDERGRELFWEAHRRTDLIRFNRFTANGIWQWKGGTAAGQTTETFRDLFPLPSSELLANPNLTQNTGYGS